MNELKKIRKFGIIGIVFLATQLWLFGVPEFELPAGTPGRQEQIDPLGQIQALTSYQNGQFCEDVLIPNTNCHLYFPIDGSQPSTQDAGVWSGARYNAADNNRVTDWWVRVFGGNLAVDQIHNGMHDVLNAPQMGFKRNGHNSHIIRINTRNIPAGFEQRFWRTFRDIAADPVGRVLLYRLLIEIRRVDNVTHEGCCGGDVILPAIYDINRVRNNYRVIAIHSATKCAFSPNNIAIKFMHNDAKETRILSVGTGGLATQRIARTTDVGLFHEMLHWFHQLRNPCKKKDNKNGNTRGFSYATRCYYGDPSTAMRNFQDAFTWRMKSRGVGAKKINGEEIATILGSSDLNTNPHPYISGGVDLINPNAFYPAPQANTSLITIGGVQQYIPNRYKFLHGEDLSENVYRASKGQFMRWGHVTRIPIPPVAWPNSPIRFRLAHKIASDCYQAITGNPPPNWRFVQGQAIN